MHKLTLIDPEARTAICSECGPTTIQVRTGDRWRCATGRAPQKRTPEQRRDSKLKNLYGIGVENYDFLYERQQGLCAICKKPEKVEGRRLAVDHNHSTGQVRGLLCTTCNQGLGNFYDDPELLESAIVFLQQVAL